MRTDLGDVAVLDAGGLVQVLPLDPLGGEAAAGDGGPAAEGLELGVNNLSVVINLNFFIQFLRSFVALHDVRECWYNDIWCNSWCI